MNDTDAQPTDAQPTNATKASDWQDPEFWKNLSQLPLVIVLSFCCCWPIGLVLIGLHPKISRKTKMIVFGCCAVLFVIMMIMGAIGVAIDNAQFDEANTLWYEGKQEEAVAIYEELVDGESGGILADSKLAIVYGRLIDHEASLQNVPRATMWIERAEKFDVVPKTRSEEAQILLNASFKNAKRQKEEEPEKPFLEHGGSDGGPLRPGELGADRRYLHKLIEMRDESREKLEKAKQLNDPQAIEAAQRELDAAMSFLEDNQERTSKKFIDRMQGSFNEEIKRQTEDNKKRFPSLY